MCIDDINKWMSSNRLKLNADKDSVYLVMYCTTTDEGKQPDDITLADAVIQVSDAVRCLGVVIDNRVSRIT